ncbi:ribonuclease domain-containing protein [Lentzea sp. NPDC051838]|uniref:ribonuclease domain-containing protein n=1 Tax=Lentzea sp. NPDC051838 TaxID=3154849 RepID=UPI003441EE5A
MSRTKPKQKSSRGRAKSVTLPTGTGKTEKNKTSSGTPKLKTAAQLAKDRLALRDQTMNAILLSAFGSTTAFTKLPDSESDDDDSTPRPKPKVAARLSFDGTELTRLAEQAAREGNKMNDKRYNTDRQLDEFTKAMNRFSDRLGESEAIAARWAKVDGLAKKYGYPLDGDYLGTHYDDLVDATTSGSRQSALLELEARLDLVTKIIDAYNTHSGLAEVTQIPSELLTAAGSLSTLNSCLQRFGKAGVTTIAGLQTLLTDADPKTQVWQLIDVAAKAGMNASDVLAEFDTITDNTTAAVHALNVLAASGKDISYFLTGDGGQRWVDLAEIGRLGMKAWAGEEIRGLRLGGPGLAVTQQQLIDRSQLPQRGPVKLPPRPGGEDPRNPRFVGRKPYRNFGVKKGASLPWADGAGRQIQYLEYDVRPYTGKGRGPERLVIGNGRTFYSPDHYTTFKEVK